MAVVEAHPGLPLARPPRRPRATASVSSRSLQRDADDPGVELLLADSGELVETRGLAAPVHTRRVQLQGGVPVVTDGPYAETYEVLAGYWVVECDSFDRATEIAARLSECPGPEALRARGVADIRPIAESRAELEI